VLHMYMCTCTYTHIRTYIFERHVACAHVYRTMEIGGGRWSRKGGTGDLYNLFRVVYSKLMEPDRSIDSTRGFRFIEEFHQGHRRSPSADDLPKSAKDTHDAAPARPKKMRQKIHYNGRGGTVSYEQKNSKEVARFFPHPPRTCWETRATGDPTLRRHRRPTEDINACGEVV
jgi:hypothetical protein